VTSITSPVQVIIAALNEELGLGPTIHELQKYLYMPHIIVVDGNSVDRTLDIAKANDAEILLQDGYGKGNALSNGIKHIDTDSKYLVLTDADFTYPAEFVPQMIDILEKNPTVGMVCGDRSEGYEERSISEFIYYLGNRVLAFLHSLINGVKVADPLTGLRVIRAIIVRDLTFKSQGFDVEIELNSHVVRSGYLVTETPIVYRKRIGEKKLKFKHAWVILRRIFLERLSS
jgi:dolichol-phosphate hexosyltransferase